MPVDLAVEARERGIKYFLISYVDLFGTLRAKLAPAAAIGDMAKEGAGFAGFASWLDMTPADPDVLAIPDPNSLIQLPWKPEVGWLAADPYMNGKLVQQAPRNILKKIIARAAEKGLQLKTGVECEFFLLSPDGGAISDKSDTQAKPCYDQSALMRRLSTLTPQQIRVLMMLSDGLMNKQIAYELSISEATVKAHVSSILQKLDVDSRTQAVIAASKIEQGQFEALLEG